eukprot:5616558-Amphidinium_carterae.1
MRSRLIRISGWYPRHTRCGPLGSFPSPGSSSSSPPPPPPPPPLPRGTQGGVFGGVPLLKLESLPSGLPPYGSFGSPGPSPPPPPNPRPNLLGGV